MLRAPMSVFDTTPMGRMMNRFSKDQYTVDEKLPTTMYSFLNMSFRVLEIVLQISIISPFFLLAMLPLSAVYTYTQKYYIATSRELKRWDSVLRSPIYSHFAESLDGVSSIR